MNPDSAADAADPTLAAATRREVARVRAMGGLGDSGRLRELFDFLAERSADLPPPKEVEIAVTVFGKAEADTLKDDPVARVYVHRLRKRLDEFYRREGAPEGVRLDVPKGQYRLVGVRTDDTVRPNAAAEQAPVRAPRSGRAFLAGAVAVGLALTLLNIAAWAVFASGGRDGNAGPHPVWGGMQDTARPAVIVVGDYYMFGDFENGPILRRLVRDFAVNSREELLRMRLEDPVAFERYTDVNLQYLPTSVAVALSRLMPSIPEGKPVRVMLASDLTPDIIKDNDILYIGLLSGLGMLRDPVFVQSRFSIGASYDEVIDTTTGETYMSDAFVAETYDGMYRDYGFFSAFDGPSGNRIVVVAGARDTGASGVAELLTRPNALETMQAAAGGADSFEALYEVEGQQNVSLDASLLAAGALDSRSIWTAQNEPRSFPSE